MRDRARQRAMAEAKSHRASAEELRDAGKRVKELEQELLTSIQLQPETKLGEDRRERYSRLLRLRALRDDFTSTRPIEVDHPNGFLLAIVMTVASLMLCGFCAGGALVGLQVLNFKPNPIDTATAFWQSVEQQDYALIHSQYLSPTLRVVYDTPAQLAAIAQASDAYYGRVTNFSLVKQVDQDTQTVFLTYQVTRHKVYNAMLTLVLHGGSWGVDNLGSSLDPSVGDSLPPPPTPSPSPNPTPSPTVLTGEKPGSAWDPW
jgi:mRNA-degrading endonuclease RelE of RelBE toxin-antitoxin system